MVGMQRIVLLIWVLVQCHCAFAYDKQVSIAAIFHNDAPYLKEWIDYHRLIGVEYFWLYDDVSNDHFREVLQPYIEEGVVEIIDWSEQREQIKNWPDIQIESYRHAIKNAIGKTKWLALIDTDEFILPMKNKTIQNCLSRYFSHAKAIYAQWRIFGTSGVRLSENESMLTQLTFCADKKHPWNSIGKSIVQPAHVLIDKIWYNHHFPLTESSDYTDGSGNKIRMKNYNIFPPTHQDKYIRINHYFFRDEKFYREVKIPRKLKRNMSIHDLTCLYQASFKKQDFHIINLLR